METAGPSATLGDEVAQKRSWNLCPGVWREKKRVVLAAQTLFLTLSMLTVTSSAGHFVLLKSFLIRMNFCLPSLKSLCWLSAVGSAANIPLVSVVGTGRFGGARQW